MIQMARGAASCLTSSSVSDGRGGAFLRRERPHFVRRPVVHDDLVAATNETPNHVAAHPTEPDHSYLHGDKITHPHRRGA